MSNLCYFLLLRNIQTNLCCFFLIFCFFLISVNFICSKTMQSVLFLVLCCWCCGFFQLSLASGGKQTYTFDGVSSVCHKWNENRTACEEYSLNGILVKNTNDAICFPSHALVSVPHTRVKTMSELEIGDTILIPHPELGFQEDQVYGFVHFEMKPQEFPMLHILFGDQDAFLDVTPNHLILVSKTSDSQPRFWEARHVTSGNFVVTQNNTKQMVTSIHEVVFVGTIYAPLTYSGVLIVNDVVVSNYASTPVHTLAHWAFQPLRWYCQVKQCSTKYDGIHPYAVVLSIISNGVVLWVWLIYLVILLIVTLINECYCQVFQK